MVDVPEIVTNYIAAWNESDAERRRRRIRSVWAPDGATCYRLLDARGYEAIEARVTGSWDKWLRDGAHVFRLHGMVSHHDAVKLQFVLINLPSGAVVANGLCFLLLDPEGRIKHDYQFNPSANECCDLVDRYLMMLNEPDPPERAGRVSQLWTEDGMLIRDRSVSKGRAAIGEEFGTMCSEFREAGLMFSSGDAAQAHHDVVKFKWRAATSDPSEAAITGTDLLILDRDRRIRFDYQFPETD